MKDANFNLNLALPNAAANNNTNGLDLNIIPGVNATGKTHSNKWRLAYFEVDVPALTNNGVASFANGVLLVMPDGRIIINGATGASQFGDVALSGIFDLGPLASTTTNAAACRAWNSNNVAVYIRGTNGIDKLVSSWP